MPTCRRESPPTPLCQRRILRYRIEQLDLSIVDPEEGDPDLLSRKLDGRLGGKPEQLHAEWRGFPDAPHQDADPVDSLHQRDSSWSVPCSRSKSAYTAS